MSRVVVAVLLTLAACSADALHGKGQKQHDDGDPDTDSDVQGDTDEESGDPDVSQQHGWYPLGTSELVPSVQRLADVTTGGVSVTSGWSDEPAIVIDNLKAFVAWSEYSGGAGDIYLREWNGTAWVELAGSAQGGGVSNTAGDSLIANLALDTSGAPVLAWQDNTSGNSQIYVRHWDGAAWSEYGGSATGTGVSASTASAYLASLAMDGDTPVVAYTDTESGIGEIFVRHWSGAAWVSYMGTGQVSQTTGWADRARVAVRGGNIMVAWEDTDAVSNSEIYVRRWTGSTWQDLAGGSTAGLRAGNSYSSNPALAIDAGGNAIVAWQAFDWAQADSNEIHVQRRTAGGWTDYQGSVTSGGFYLNGTNYWRIALALDDADRPTVAWSDNTTGLDEAQLRHWTGFAWEDLSLSSAAPGVSNSATSSVNVAVSADARTCLAWAENDDVDSEIVMRCHDL